MKTLQNIALTILISLSAYGFAQAATERPLKAMDQVITAYIDCTTQGNLENVKYIFSDNFRHSMNRNGNLFIINKKEMIDFLQTTKNIKQNCETTYNIVESSPDCAIVKVSMKYANFTKVDLVTICASEDGWAVSQVVSTYP